jgi:hypothetical protein
MQDSSRTQALFDHALSTTSSPEDHPSAVQCCLIQSIIPHAKTSKNYNSKMHYATQQNQPLCALRFAMLKECCWIHVLEISYFVLLLLSCSFCLVNGVKSCARDKGKTFTPTPVIYATMLPFFFLPRPFLVSSSRLLTIFGIVSVM